MGCECWTRNFWRPPTSTCRIIIAVLENWGRPHKFHGNFWSQILDRHGHEGLFLKPQKIEMCPAPFSNLSVIFCGFFMVFRETETKKDASFLFQTFQAQNWKNTPFRSHSRVGRWVGVTVETEDWLGESGGFVSWYWELLNSRPYWRTIKGQWWAP